MTQLSRLRGAKNKCYFLEGVAFTIFFSLVVVPFVVAWVIQVYPLSGFPLLRVRPC